MFAKILLGLDTGVQFISSNANPTTYLIHNYTCSKYTNIGGGKLLSRRVPKKRQIACTQHSGINAKLNNLANWQVSQDRNLERICDEMKSIKKWIIVTLLGILFGSGLLVYVAQIGSVTLNL